MAPKTGPISVPMPPTITMARMLKASDNEERIRHQSADEACVEAAGGAGDRRPTPKAKTFQAAPLMPSEAADTSSSRIAVSVSPIGDRTNWLSRMYDKESEARDQIKERGEIAEVGNDHAANDNRRRRRDAVNAERPLRQADPVQQDLVNDDGKAERGDRQIVPAQAHREQREKRSGNAREGNARNERNPERNAELHDQKRRDIGAQPIERRMPEVELAGIAEDEVEPDGEQHVDRADRQVRPPIGVGEDERQNAMTAIASA